MPLFGRKGSSRDDDQPAPEQTRAASEPEESASEADGPANEEEALLNDYSDVSDQDGGGDKSSDLDLTAIEAEPAEEDDGSGEPGDNDTDDLMSIFTSEEAEDQDIMALTKDLEDIEVQSLLDQAQDLSNRFRNRGSAM